MLSVRTPTGPVRALWMRGGAAWAVIAPPLQPVAARA